MRFTNQISVVALSFIIGGCAPLQQAPLLYSSKTTVGIDLSASTTEAPGASINIGVKVVDAAYVPVAVSKDTQVSRNGETKSFDIVKIDASYGDAATGSNEDTLTEENKTKIKGYLDAKRAEDSSKQELEQATSSLANVIKSRDALKQSLRARQKDKEIALSAQSVDPVAINAIRVDIDSLSTELQDSEEQVRLLTIERDGKGRNWNEKKAEAERLFLAAAQAASLLRTNKRDAMSVYGRFDSNGAGSTGSSPSANLAVGKIFSTGVASQNLTEAVKNDALYSGVARCIDGVKGVIDKLSDQAKKNELIEKIGEICGLSGGLK